MVDQEFTKISEEEQFSVVSAMSGFAAGGRVLNNATSKTKKFQLQFKGNALSDEQMATLSITSESLEDRPQLARYNQRPNPFYKKSIKKITSTKNSLILRLPFKLCSTLGLAFSNFNPRACNWVDRFY